MKTDKRLKTLDSSVGSAWNKTYIVTQLTINVQKGSIQVCHSKIEEKQAIVSESENNDDEEQC